MWRAEREKVPQSAEALTAQLRARSSERRPAGRPCPAPRRSSGRSRQFRQAVRRAARRVRRRAEVSAPVRAAVPAARARARPATPRRARHGRWRTLRAMALGGMRDHIGGGFHRYSVDAAWRVPHFEKMLYDQAQLVLAFLEGGAGVRRSVLRWRWPRTRCVRHARDDRRRRRLLLGRGRRQRAAGSTPASRAPHKMEGAFYLWRADELDALLGDDAPIVKRRFGIEPDGNAPLDPQQEFTGKNLLYVARSVDELAQRDPAGRPSEVVETLNRARLAMFEHRLAAAAAAPRRQGADGVERPDDRGVRARGARPARSRRRWPDGARVGRISTAARRAAAFIRDRMWNADSRRAAAPLPRRPREIDGYAEDYAYLIFGLLELFQADPRSGVARVGDRAAAPAGRAVLGRGRRRLVQHDRPRSDACCCG